MSAAYLKAPHLDVIQFCRKIAYDSRPMANRSIKAMNKPAGVADVGFGVLQAYKCRICEGWHVGHYDRSR
jgi:hypothetical protein